MTFLPPVSKPHRLLVFAILLLAAPVGRGQVTTSNLGVLESYFYEIKSNSWVGQAFTTDANSYTLNSVTLSMRNATLSGGMFSVGIYSNNSNNPGSLLETLSGSTSPDSYINYTFTSSGLSLTANNTYHVVASVSSGLANYSWVNTSDNSTTGAWGFPNYITLSSDQGVNWAQAGTKMILSVTATPIPEPGTYSAIFGALALGVVVWRRRRSA
jgi:hypothetical protein